MAMTSFCPFNESPFKVSYLFLLKVGLIGRIYPIKFLCIIKKGEGRYDGRNSPVGREVSS